MTVHITFVDTGVKGCGPRGMTVSEVAELHGIDIGPTAVAGVVERVNSDVWTEDLFGEGASLDLPRQGAAAWAASCRRGRLGAELLRSCGTTTTSRPFPDWGRSCR